MHVTVAQESHRNIERHCSLLLRGPQVSSADVDTSAAESGYSALLQTSDGRVGALWEGQGGEECVGLSLGADWWSVCVRVRVRVRVRPRVCVLVRVLPGHCRNIAPGTIADSSVKSACILMPRLLVHDPLVTAEVNHGCV